MVQAVAIFIVITLTYNLGQLIFAIKSKVIHKHYFIGFGPQILNFQLAGIKFTLGIFVPIFPFARWYHMVDGKKERASLPWEFHQFSIGKRVLVTLGGTVFLILAGIITFIATSYFDVEQYISKEEVNKWGIYPSELAQQAGFKKGDKVLSVNGKEYQNFYELLQPAAGTTYQVLREGKTLDLTIKEETIHQIPTSYEVLFLYLQTPLEVGEVMPNSFAFDAGLIKGDKIISVNEVPVYKSFELQKELKKDTVGEALLRFVRSNANNKDTLDTKVVASEEGKLGFIVDEHIQYSQKENSFPEAVVKGVKKSWQVVASNVMAMFNLSLEPKPTKMGSFTTISRAYQEGIDWHRIGTLTGLYFLLVAVLSLLPLPRAIFWELLALTYEGISKKTLRLSTFKFLTKLSYVLLAGMMLYSLISDVVRALK